MDFEYLALGCGGAGIMAQIGFLTELVKSNKLDHKKIKEIHGVSAGSIAGGLLILSKFNMELLKEYFIQRPWEKILNLNAEDFFNTFKNQGYAGIEFFKEVLIPFLSINNFDENLTLKELYDFSKIKLFIYATDINSLNPKSIKLSYESYPNLSLVKAIQMSCSYPLIFRPVYFENYCFVDGGITNSMPIPEEAYINCPDKILALELPATDKKEKESYLKENDNLIKFILQFFNACKSIIFNNIKKLTIKNRICITCDNSLSTWFKSINTKEVREQYVKDGENSCKEFIKSYIN